MMRVVVALFSVVVMYGCQQAQPKKLLQLEKYGAHEAAIYTVLKDGYISFSGGMDAFTGHSSWQGSLTAAQLSELQLILSQKLTPAAQVDQNRFVVTVHGADPIAVSLDNEIAIRLYDSLIGMTNERYSELLGTLPRPTTKIIIDRSVEGERSKTTVDADH